MIPNPDWSRAPPPSMRFFRLTFKCFVDCF